MKKCAKSCESTKKYERTWKSVPSVDRVLECTLKVEKVCQKIQKCAKSWESMIKC
jgi:hypothetical protein